MRVTVGPAFVGTPPVVPLPVVTVAPGNVNMSVPQFPVIFQADTSRSLRGATGGAVGRTGRGRAGGEVRVERVEGWVRAVDKYPLRNGPDDHAREPLCHRILALRRTSVLLTTTERRRGMPWHGWRPGRRS